MKRRGATGALLVAALLGLLVGAPHSGAATVDVASRGPRATAGPAAATEVERVWLVTVPTLTWELVVDGAPPVLTTFLEQAAVASASVRTLGVTTTPGEGYATIGAGNRVAVPDVLAGSAFAPGTAVDGEPAAAVLERRGGGAAGDGGVVHLGLPALGVLNDRLLYGAEPGALGSALADAGLVAAVVGNADVEADLDLGVEPAQVRREVALAVADGGGIVPVGSVGPELVRTDPAAPLGLRLDPDAVLRAVDLAVAADAAVVAVELSDLDRADLFRPVAGRDAAIAARQAALADTDELLGALLARIDLEREVVVLLAPTTPRGPPQLVVAALAGAGIEPGLAVSGTTGRAGFVTLPDVAPTVLALLGVDAPGAMTGAPMSSAGGGAPDRSTFEARVADNERALFRNEAAGPLTVVFIIVLVLALALAAVALRGRRPALRRPAAALQLVALSVPLVTYLAGLVRDDRLGVAGSIVATFAAAAAVAGVVTAVGRLVARGDRVVTAYVPPLLVLAATAITLLADVFVGSPLQLDTAFGYGGGAIVAGRFTGYGNLAGGLLTLAVIAVTTGAWGMVALRRGRRGLGADGASEHPARPSRPVVAAIAVAFAFVVVVTGLPGLGRDVGGILAIVPGFALVLALLAGVRVSWGRIVAVGVATLGILGAFAAVDLSRPPERRGHLGRLVERTLGDEGAAGLLTVVERKVDANLSILVSSVWSTVIPVAVAFIAFLLWRPPGAVGPLLRLPGLRAFLIGSLGTCALAAVLNDSGIAIPGIMLTLLLPYVAHLALELPGVGDER